MFIKTLFGEDFSFGTGIDLVGGAGTCVVNQILEQTDGKIIVTGNFNRYNGNVVPPLIRLLSNGSLDTTFNFSGSDVVRIGLQSDNKIIYSDGVTLNRLDLDGTADGTFSLVEPSCTVSIANPCILTVTGHGAGAGYIQSFRFRTTGALPTGLSVNTVYYILYKDANTFYVYDTLAHAVAGGSTGRIVTSGSQSGSHYQRIEGFCQNFFVHDDDKITVYFQGNGSTLPSLFYRCSSSGAVVSKLAKTFVIGYEPDVYSIIESKSESYSIVGDDYVIYSQVISGSYQIDGFLTTNIFTDMGGTNYNNTVIDLVNIKDAKAANEDYFYLVGEFTNDGSSNKLRLARAYVGNKDTLWSGATGFNDTSTCIAVNNDKDKLYVGGDFTDFRSTAVKGLVRVNVSDASLDTGFNLSSDFNDYPQTVKVLSNDNVIVGGFFTSVSGATQNRICLFDEYGNLLS